MLLCRDGTKTKPKDVRDMYGKNVAISFAQMTIKYVYVVIIEMCFIKSVI